MLHYTACGLDNVWLENGYKLVRTPYGSGVSVEHADELHRILAIDVARKAGPLGRKEFRFLRTMLCLSQKSFAEMVGVKEQSVSLWERHGNIPVAAETVLRTLVLEALNDGKELIRKTIERINTVDRLVNQKIVASAARDGWTARSTAPRAARKRAPTGRVAQPA